MELKQEIQGRISEFSALCKAHKVKTLYAFGSSVTDRFNEKTSDIDLLVEIDDDDPIKYLSDSIDNAIDWMILK